MKKLIILVGIVCLSTLIQAQVKVETFDSNKWQWVERSSKKNSVVINDGVMTLTTLKFDKKADTWHQIATTFGRVPMRANDNYKLTVKAILPTNSTSWSFYFNVTKNCLQIEEGETAIEGWMALAFVGNYYMLSLGNGLLDGKLPVKFQKKNQPIEIVLTKKGGTAIIEINGMEIFNDKCVLTEPCIGFRSASLKQSLIIEEVRVEQAAEDD